MRSNWSVPQQTISIAHQLHTTTLLTHIHWFRQHLPVISDSLVLSEVEADCTSAKALGGSGRTADKPADHWKMEIIRMPARPRGQRSLPPLPRPRSLSPCGSDCTTVVAEEDEAADEAADMAGNNSFPAGEMNAGNRNAASPTSSHPGSQANGTSINSGAYMTPLPVGHQQDLNFLFSQIQELSSLLASNREKVSEITRNAEEVARRANGNTGGTESGENESSENHPQIRELKLELAKKDHIISLYKHEQTKNTKLIAEYEDAVGTMTEQIRNYCTGIEGRFLSQRRHYNDLLQQEKDDHLQSRLARDHWFNQTLRLSEMIRTAYRLRCDEWNDEYRVVVGLQLQVRVLRRIVGLDPEKPEEETGWPYLKDAPLEDQG